MTLTRSLENFNYIRKTLYICYLLSDYTPLAFSRNFYLPQRFHGLPFNPRVGGEATVALDG